MTLFPQRALIVDSGEVKADALVVLGGDKAGQRPVRAAELFAKGVAPKIVVSGDGDNEANARILEARGVPSEVIFKEDLSRSTLENAKFSIPLLRAMGAHRVVIVTSWYHSRRALACFAHFASEMKFYSCPAYFASSPREWHRSNTATCILSEIIKLPLYWVRYGVKAF